MVDKAKDMIPDFIREAVAEPLNKAEKTVEKAREMLTQNVNKLDTIEVRKVFDDVLARLKTAREEVEGYFSTGRERTLAALNVPSRGEIDTIKADLAKLTKDIKDLKKGAAPKKPAATKPAAKKPVAKKPAAKKAAGKKK